MKRNENEKFEDYKLRLKASKAELRAKRKGVWKKKRVIPEVPLNQTQQL